MLSSAILLDVTDVGVVLCTWDSLVLADSCLSYEVVNTTRFQICGRLYLPIFLFSLVLLTLM